MNIEPQNRIIVNFEHRLIQICIFSRRVEKNQKPLFFKNYFIESQYRQNGFQKKLNDILHSLSEQFSIDVTDINVIFYDNHIITKKVSVEVMSRFQKIIDTKFFERIKSKLLANSIIKKNYKACAFWIEQIKNLETKANTNKLIYKNKVNILCDYLPNSEYRNILELISSQNTVRNIHLLPASKCVKSYFQNSTNKAYQNITRSSIVRHIVHVLDNRIVVYRIKNCIVDIFSSFRFGIMNVITEVSEQLQISRKICLELFFSTEEVFLHFSNMKILQIGSNKQINLTKIRNKFVLLLHKQLLPVFTGEIQSVILMGRSVQSYIFMQFVDKYLKHINVTCDLTAFLREKHLIYFKLIGANCLLSNQDKFLW